MAVYKQLWSKSLHTLDYLDDPVFVLLFLSLLFVLNKNVNIFVFWENIWE